VIGSYLFAGIRQNVALAVDVLLRAGVRVQSVFTEALKKLVAVWGERRFYIASIPPWQRQSGGG
jgi:uncharacterized membrane protein